MAIRKKSRKWSALAEFENSSSVPPFDSFAIERHRHEVYQSYENFLRNRLSVLDGERAKAWKRDYSTVRAYLRSIRPMRERLKQMLGFWIEPCDRLPFRKGRTEVLANTPEFVVHRFQFEVLPGLKTYALELIPRSPGPHSGLLIQHGYGITPEIACDIAAKKDGRDYGYRGLGLRAVRKGFHVLAVHHPSGFGSLEDMVGTIPGFEQYGHNYGKNRLHRLAIMTGGTLFGLDMMASSRGIDYLLQHPRVAKGSVGMYGKSQGGQSALFLPALDERIMSSVASAYFNARLPKLIGPNRARSYLDSQEEDKFFTDVIRWFSDSDLVSLIAPRAFAVEAGKVDGAVDFEKAEREFALAQRHYGKLRISAKAEFIAHRDGHVCGSSRALEFLEETLKCQKC